MTPAASPVKPVRGTPPVPPVQAVARAVRVLSAFTVERPTLTLHEIAQRVKLSKTTVRRLLLTLQDVALVTRDATGDYRLGVRCLEFAAVAQASIEVRQCALPVMRRLVEDLGETAYLLAPRGTEAICLEIVEARRGVRMLFAEVGSTFPLHAGAAPRALLAAAPEAVVRDVLAAPFRAHTPQTITDPAALARDIEATRAAGYSFSVDDLVPGIAGIGAVIRDRHAEAVAAVSVSGLRDRFLGPERERLVRTVVGAAREISLALGCAVQRLGAPPSPPPVPGAG